MALFQTSVLKQYINLQELSVVEKAYKSGIPVLIVDRKTEGDNYTAYLGGDNYEVGTNAANYLASLSTENKKIIEIKGLSGSSPAFERSLICLSLRQRQVLKSQVHFPKWF